MPRAKSRARTRTPKVHKAIKKTGDGRWKLGNVRTNTRAAARSVRDSRRRK